MPLPSVVSSTACLLLSALYGLNAASACCCLQFVACTLVSTFCCLQSVACTLVSTVCCQHSVVCMLLSALCCLHSVVCILLCMLCWLTGACSLLSQFCCMRFAVYHVLSDWCSCVGVEEHCTEYLYVEQRQGWEAEQRRLKKELEKHSKQAAKVGCTASLLVLSSSRPSMLVAKADKLPFSVSQQLLIGSIVSVL